MFLAIFIGITITDTEFRGAVNPEIKDPIDKRAEFYNSLPLTDDHGYPLNKEKNHHEGDKDHHQMKLRLFYNSAVIATILSYLLIFIGGLVRVSGAGMGCPSWPKCGEGWIPPTNVDINQINTTLAWIEFTNRMFGVVLGRYLKFKAGLR